ncbi:ABC transporter substrate-binding protein [Cohnella soli]|uniref:ABC transporter substrate-binding protein n=1 Tax=Cohnella soli TaxID=425005 RepID=A0ABW0I2F3_9BACL
MGKSKTLLVWLALMLVFATVAAGCRSGSGDKGTASPSAAASQSATGEASPSGDGGGQPAKELEGTIKVSLNNGKPDVWGAVGEAYAKLHPKVKVVMDMKPTNGYKEWLTSQFAAGQPDADIVQSNEVSELYGQKKFVNYYPYFDKVSPYTNKPWKDGLDLDAMSINMSAVGAEDALYVLNFETIQIVWMYNKDIFAKVGIASPPATFREMIDDFKKIKEAGYIPFAAPGNALSLWSGTSAWPLMIYSDQYFRDMANVVRSQPGDYSYVPEIDDNWKYDLADPYNDIVSKVTVNPLRAWKAIKDKTGGYKVAGNPAWKDFMNNIKELYSYAEPGLFATDYDQAYKLFLTSKAAVMLSSPASIWQLPKDLKDSAKNGGEGSVKPFELGFFNNPSMEGEHVLSPARTIAGAIGFYSVIAKDAAQNDLNMDFLMFITSPLGYQAYADAVQKSNDASLAGPPALKGIELSEDLKKVFDQFQPIGKVNVYADLLDRGLWAYQPTVQIYTGNIQKFIQGDLTVDQYLDLTQQMIDKYTAEAMQSQKLELSDLDHPERRPPERK